MKAVDNFVGKNLVEARVARGLRQSSLARMVDLSPAQVSKYEKGIQQPSSASLGRICEALSMPLNYFLAERDAGRSIGSAIFYRSMSAATKQQRNTAEQRFFWLKDIYAYLDEYVEFPAPNLPKLHTPISPEVISSEFIEEAAELARNYWHIGEAPVENLTRLLENNGFIISFHDLEADTLDAFSQLIEGRPFVVVSTQKLTAARVRFSLAHELGHLLLHKKVAPEVLNNKVLFKLMEEQANRFAAAFLFPQNAFNAEIPLPNLATFKLRKARWRMSIAAMIGRARDLDLIDDSEQQKLRRSYGRRKWSRFEPLDEEIPINYPELLCDAVKLLAESDSEAKINIVEALKLPSQDIEELTALEQGFLQLNVAKLKLKKKVLSMQDYVKAQG